MADTMTNYTDTAEFQAEVNEFFAKFDAIGDVIEAADDADDELMPEETFWHRWQATACLALGAGLALGGAAGMALRHLA